MIQKMLKLLISTTATIVSILPLQAMAEDRRLEGFRLVDLPTIEISSQNPFSLAGDFLSYVGVETADTEVSLDIETVPEGYVFNFRLSGYKDDSLSGENYRVLIDQHQSRYFISEAGVQYLCARGENILLPQSNYCP